jgi:hypothetical protein
MLVKIHRTFEFYVLTYEFKETFYDKRRSAIARRVRSIKLNSTNFEIRIIKK